MRNNPNALISQNSTVTTLWWKRLENHGIFLLVLKVFSMIFSSKKVLKPVTNQFMVFLQPWIQIVIFLIFCHRDEQSKCLLTQDSPNKLTSFTRNNDIYASSKQCKEFVKEDYAEWHEVTSFLIFQISKSKYSSPNQCSHSLFQYPDDCVQMWCLRKDGRTETNRAPWVDGTPCADGKICQHQKCV